jgi:hypothetical protein
MDPSVKPGQPVTKKTFDSFSDRYASWSRPKQIGFGIGITLLVVLVIVGIAMGVVYGGGTTNSETQLASQPAKSPASSPAKVTPPPPAPAPADAPINCYNTPNIPECVTANPCLHEAPGNTNCAKLCKDHPEADGCADILYGTNPCEKYPDTELCKGYCAQNPGSANCPAAQPNICAAMGPTSKECMFLCMFKPDYPGCPGTPEAPPPVDRCAQDPTLYGCPQFNPCINYPNSAECAAACANDPTYQGCPVPPPPPPPPAPESPPVDMTAGIPTAELPPSIMAANGAKFVLTQTHMCMSITGAPDDGSVLQNTIDGCAATDRLGGISPCMGVMWQPQPDGSKLAMGCLSTAMKNPMYAFTEGTQTYILESEELKTA